MNNILKTLEKYDFATPTTNIDTGQIVRWGLNNRHWIRRFDGGYVFGDFVSGLNTYIFDKRDEEYSQFELKTIKKHMQEAQRETQIELQKTQEQAAAKAQSIWNEAKNTSEHPYLTKKRISSHGLKKYEKCLAIPLYDANGKLWSLQFIAEDGDKRFLSGGKKKGCYFALGTLPLTENAFICEGYATGATIYECSEKPVVIAFDAGNLKSVAQAIREKHPELKLIICADNDQYGPTNTGLIKANEAALAVNAKTIFPTFSDTSAKPTDFNDLYILEGKEAVNAILNKAFIEETENKANIPAGFVLSDDGLFCFDPKIGQLARISNYIRTVAFTRNNGEIGRLIEFRDYKNSLLRTLIKPKMFTKDGEQIRVHLISQGFIYSGNALSKRKLFEYIASSVPGKEAVLVSKIGFTKSIYVRPDCVIGSSEEEIVLDESLQDESYGTSGTLQQWNDLIARWCVGNSRLIFAISSAFAGTLLDSCNLSNFGFHFVGNSSSGKTTCLNVAASVFGSSDYVVSWKTTDNALEATAVKRNDALLILDELSEMSSDKAGDVAYMLANGQGKKRLDKNCNAKQTLSWRLIFISSGEIDLNTHMAEAHKTSKAGQKVRFLNIPAKASESSFGIFENLMGFQDGAEFSNYLREKASKYFGTPSVEFIKHVLKHSEEIKAEYREEFLKLKAQYLPKNAEGQDLRAFEKFMFVGFAGELAIKYGVICWKPGAAYQAAVSCFNSWLEDKGGTGDDENRQILEHIKAFFELHGHSRFFNLEGFPDQKIINMAGYKTIYKDDVTFFVSPSVFQNEICKSFSRKSVIELLIANGFLLKDRNGDYRQQKWTPDGNKKVYVVSGKILL